MADLIKIFSGASASHCVVFLHGLGGSAVDTWRHEDCSKEDFWLHWVGQKTTCDIWSVSYDADISAWRELAMPLVDQGDQILDLLATHPNLKDKLLILVGHSMGGLVIKSLMISAHTKGDSRLEELLLRIAGVVFIGTPHLGSQLANLARALKIILKTNDQVANLVVNDAFLRQLNKQFQNLMLKMDCAVRVYAETQGVPVGLKFFKWHLGGYLTVVEASSSDPLIPGVTAVPLAGNHFTICKPKQSDLHINLSLCEFIDSVKANRRVSGVKADSGRESNEGQDKKRSNVGPGRLVGFDDNRLQPREKKIYGREKEILRVVEFLCSINVVSSISLQVVGVGGIGKTEVCKAALKQWLMDNPQSVAYYIDLPDRASALELIDGIGRAIGVEAIVSLKNQVVPRGVYFIDNLESVLEQHDGADVFRTLLAHPGVRVLAASRLNSNTLFSQSLVINSLPDFVILRLFRDLWAGSDSLPDDEELRFFVIDVLGAHTLSVSLCARVGDCYSYSELVEKWKAFGVGVVDEVLDATRIGSLPISMRLTAQALEKDSSALDLWIAAALFVPKLSEDLICALERNVSSMYARRSLVRHHVINKKGAHWHMLPPVARYALDESLQRTAGFDWFTARNAVRKVVQEWLVSANSVASTGAAIAARTLILDNIEAFVKIFHQELSVNEIDFRWIENSFGDMVNVLQFTPIAGEILTSNIVDKFPEYALAMYALANIKNQLGRPNESRMLYERVLKIYEVQGIFLGKANTLRAMGELESRLGRGAEAKKFFNGALDIYIEEQALLGQANTLRALGFVERRAGHLSEAKLLYLRALAIFESLQEGLGQANALKALGDLERGMLAYAASLDAYGRALTLFEKERENVGRESVLRSIWSVAKLMGNPSALSATYEGMAVERSANEINRDEVKKVIGVLENKLGRRTHVSSWVIWKDVY